MKFHLAPLVLFLLSLALAFAIVKLLVKLAQKKILARQQALGEKLLATLREAAQKNMFSNMLPNGTLFEYLSPIDVASLPTNTGAYSLVVFMDGMGAIEGRLHILRVDINLLHEDPAKRIYVSGDHFHGDLYFSEEGFVSHIPLYADSVAYYALFPETQKVIAEYGMMPPTFMEMLVEIPS